MVEPLSGWVVMMAVIAIVVLVIVLTFSNLGKDDKNERRNKRGVSPKAYPPRGSRRKPNNFLH